MLIAVHATVLFYLSVSNPKVFYGFDGQLLLLLLLSLFGPLQLEHLFHEHILLQAMFVELALIDLVQGKFDEVTILFRQLLLLLIHDLTVLPFLVDFE